MHRLTFTSSILSLLPTLQTLFLASALYSAGTAPGQDTAITRRIEALLNRNPESVLEGPVEIGADSTHQGGILMVNGHLIVSGKVIGDIVIVDGDLSLRGEAEVEGKIIVLGGKAFSSRLSRIIGELEIYSFNVKVKKRAGRYFIIREESVREGFAKLELRGLKGFGLGPYNRVDGLPLLFHLRLGDGNTEERWNLTIKPIYRVAAHRWGWELYWEGNRLWKLERVGVGYYSETVTNDDYRMSDFENTIAAILFKEDFRNYYEKRALELWFELPSWWDVTLGCEFEAAEYFSMERMAEFSFFGWGKEFRLNPPVEEGRSNSVSIYVTHDTRDNEDSPESGWFNTLTIERAGDPFGADFTFTRFEADVRRYNRLGFNAHLDFRFFFHYGDDHLPAVRHLTMGGVGGLRGYPDSSFGGDRILLGSVEFRYLLTDELKHSMLFRDGMDLVAFFDVGEAKAGPLDITTGDLKTDAGVGISGSGLLSYFGLFVAQSLTDTELEPRVTVRVSRDF